MAEAQSPNKKGSVLGMMARKSKSPSPSSPGASAEAQADEAAKGLGAIDISDGEAHAAQPLTAPDFEAVDGKPKAGFTTAGAGGLQLLDGDGTGFELRIGPEYKRHGKKAPSLSHVYAPITIDVFKRKKVAFHVASKLTLPPPPDGSSTPNTTGLPRRIVVNAIIPAEAPPMLGSTDGSCYQIVVVFGASAASLAQWQASATPAAKLFARFVANAPEGVTPSSGDVDIKERLKLLPRLDNMSSLGLPSWIAGYNGKPALITKSGALYRGDDYLEIGMNTFRFGERPNDRTAPRSAGAARMLMRPGVMRYAVPPCQASSRRRACTICSLASPSSTSTRR